MGLDTVDKLRSFCLELSNDRPSPGGGTAAAAAGAMAASLLVMVCEITMKSKKHESSKPELLDLRSRLLARRDDLIALSADDAKSYDMVVEAIRDRRAKPGDASERTYQGALKHASEIPQKTAAECLMVLETAAAVAIIGTKSAKSDVGVAIHLARAGFEGAVMNVKINLDGITDESFVRSARETIDVRGRQAGAATDKALAALAER